MTPSFNEEAGIKECYERVKEVFDTQLQEYDYEHLFIDNCSSDNTVLILKEIAANDTNVKIIVNSRNFGLSRSPYYGMLQMTGDAFVPIVADLQTPPALIPGLVRKWEAGYKMVLCIRIKNSEGIFIRLVRELFYYTIKKLSTVEQIKHFIGFGLFDKKIIQILKEIDDPTPYFRGIISEIGFEKAFVEYHQPPRLHGKSRHSFYDLLELAILGFTSYSKVPLRIMTVLGFAMSCMSLVVSLGYLIAKLLFWDLFDLGLAPLVVGFFFFASIQMLCIGLIGEYIGVIFEKVQRRPLVIEKERINF
jgi:glycosyltransferase involved in cell wall biosynthesis